MHHQQRMAALGTDKELSDLLDFSAWKERADLPGERTFLWLKYITRFNAASDAPTATLLSLFSQICLRYARHSKTPRLIAFKIEMESRSQLLNTSPSHLLPASEAATPHSSPVSPSVVNMVSFMFRILVSAGGGVTGGREQRKS
ncbi:hypothetical protein INR49_002421 [Caranx melampygus]|nr:hypothetical protein INR49_002421 [Caranx melampygus]